MRIEIFVERAKALWKTIDYTDPKTVVFGSAATADIKLDGDPKISGRHFELTLSASQCRLRDLGSLNGTYIGRNGRYVRYGGTEPLPDGMTEAPAGALESALVDKDVISAGETTLRIKINSEKDEATTRIPETMELPTNDTAPWRAASETLAFNPALFEGYTLLEKLGQGGMGTVFKARQHATGQIVAIKTLLPRDGVDVARQTIRTSLFVRESELHSLLKHTNIVEELDVIRAGPIVGLVLEYIEGVTLSRHVQQCGGSLELEEAVPLMLGVLAGLAFVHAKKIIHRDLKPENIFLAKSGTCWIPKVADFGLCKRYENTGNSVLALAGTPPYWPREHVKFFSKLSPASDVFSVAAVFYWMLTGTHAREGMTELLASQGGNDHLRIKDYEEVIEHGRVVPISQRLPGLPLPVCAVFDRALAEDYSGTQLPSESYALREKIADMRYSNALAFKDALTTALSRVAKTRLQGASPGGASDCPATQIDIESRVAAWRDKRVKEQARTPDAPAMAGRALLTILDTRSERDAGLLVLDLVSSTELIRQQGDTYYAGIIHLLFRQLTTHSAARHNFFLSCTGDGFFAAFDDANAALAVAKSFLDAPVFSCPTHMALHWGRVKSGPGGNPLGEEMHRCFRMEGIKAQDCIEPVEGFVLPQWGRIVCSRNALEKLSEPGRAAFCRAGRFHLKGFDEAQEVFVAGQTRQAGAQP